MTPGHSGRVHSKRVAIALGLGTLSAALAARVWAAPFHLDDSSLSGAVETAAAMLCVASAGLLAYTFGRSRLTRDLMLLAAVACAAACDITFAAAPALSGLAADEPSPAARVTVYLLVALSFLAAAWARDEPLERGTRRAELAATLIAVVPVGLAEIVNLGIAGAHGSSSTVTLSPFLVALTIVSCVTMIATGIVFLFRSRRTDVSAGLLGGACFLLGGAMLEPVTMPMLGANWVSPDDGFRLLAYAMVAAVSVRGYIQMRGVAAERALTRERERIARDLHDGLAQDLAVIALHAQTLEREMGDEHPLTVAARRALAVARGELLDLSAASAPSLRVALERVAGELSMRHGVHVTVSADAPVPEPSRARREHMVRIAREAVVNAVTHGAAHRVEITLESCTDGYRMHIADDGTGPADGELAPHSGRGFGLPAMRARASELGGALTARPRPHGGMELELSLPPATVRQPSHAARP